MRRSPARPASALRLVAQRDFGLYFCGNAASATGTWFQNLAASLLVFRLTHSAFLLGVLNFSTFVPTLILFPWAGRAADRFDRRRLLICTQVASTLLAAALAAAAWAGHATAGLTIGIAAGLGVAGAFTNTTAVSLLPLLVGRDDLASAIGLNSLTFNLARAVGPVLAAVVVGTLGIPAAFAINAGSYLFLAGGLVFVRPAPQERLTRETSRFRASLSLLREQPRLAAYLLIVAVVGFGSDPVNTLAPAYARVFGHRDTFAGVLIGAFGLGAVSAAVILGRRIVSSRRRMPVTLALLGGGIVAFSLSPSFGVALPFLFVAGFGYLASNTGASSRLQLEIAEAHRGRVSALWSVAFLGLRPFASLADGGLAGAFGVRTAGVVLAVPALAVATAILYVAKGGSRGGRPITTEEG